MGYKRIAVDDGTMQRIKMMANERGITMMALLREFASDDAGDGATECAELTEAQYKMIADAKQTALRTSVSIKMVTHARLTILSELTGQSKATLLEAWSHKILMAFVKGDLQIAMR